MDEMGIGSECATGFKNVRIYTPGMPGVGLGMPPDLRDLPKEGAVVICLQGMDILEKCLLARDILRTASDILSQETDPDEIKRLLVIEESHYILPQMVPKDRKVKEAATEVLININQFSRGRLKRGGVICPITQLPSDFQSGGRAIREMIHARVIHRLTDSELEYVQNYLRNKELLEQVPYLKKGEAFLVTPDIPATKILVRPPFSSVREPSIDEIRKINSRSQSTVSAPSNGPELSDFETKAMEVIRDYYRTHHEGILATDLDKGLNLKRGRQRQELLDSLVRKGLIEKLPVPGRGNPVRVIPLN